jgi:hypothetical protein
MSVLDSIRNLFGAATPRARYARDVSLILSVTYPANAPSGSKLTVGVQEDPSQAATNVFQIPLDRTLVVEDIYVVGEQAVDGILLIYKNGDQLVSQTPPINSMLVSNPSRSRVQAFVLNQGDRLSALFVNTTTNSSNQNIRIIAKGRYIVS